MEHTLLPRHGGMDMGMASNVSCTAEMIWNWNTIDSCFLAESWHVTTKAMFAVSCIGVALLGVSLEFLRRVSKDYEESLQRQFQRHAIAQLDDPLVCGAPPSVMTFRASPIQQVIRAILHVAQFGTAYITMLIAMYYNGYTIISIFIGAFLGKLFFDWGQYRVVLGQTQGPKQATVQVQEEATKCCG
ncbi:Ctr copper transporter family-domain-containing protein [Aspergillus keveii]|uniref:Copper transport protein n=1 Tax=Aspergillus keveii TaxID=714993 RepID=A0ABR4G251_9EURO